MCITDDRQATLEALALLADQQVIMDFPNRFRGKEGAYHHLEWRATPYGNLCFAAARDIS